MKTPTSTQETHYLKQELFDLVINDNIKFLEFISNGPLDGLWFWDLENPEHEWMSEKFWTELGYEPSEMPHSPESWRGIINADDLENSGKAIQKHIENPDIPFNEVLRYKHKDGSTVYIRCRAYCIKNDEGTPIRMLGTHINITKRIQYGIEKQINQELEHLNKALELKNSELEQFTYITSHDLQEPLNLILSFSELLKMSKTGLDDVGQKSIDVITDAAIRMKDLITALLFYSRIGKQPEKKQINFQNVLEAVKTELKDEIATSGAEINYVGNLNDFDVFENDFYQLILNLTSNAIKYVAEGVKPDIIIDCKDKGDSYLFSFKDNGIGIDKQYFERIFQVFQRLHTKNKYPGTGIGLAHCKKVLSLHNGKIWVESTLGEGSVFYFTIEK